MQTFQKMGPAVFVVLLLSLSVMLPSALETPALEACQQLIASAPVESPSLLQATRGPSWLQTTKNLSKQLWFAAKEATSRTALTCADFSIWPDVDNGVTCGAGSCMALVLSENNGGRCDTYCESFGHTCIGAHEEVRETCRIAKTYRCDEAIPRTSDILCKCESGDTPPSPDPAPSPSGDSCADFTLWPDVDGVTCGAGSCMALVLSENNGGRCDTYCESFGHTCVGAYEEVRETCRIKETFRCDEAIPDTSDILCKCESGPGPAPSPGEDSCADFTLWPDVDGVTCGAGSCMALVLSENYGGRCDTYCSSFGHSCVGAFEEVAETCQIMDTFRCDERIPDTSDILCKCIGSYSPPPVPEAPSGSTLVNTDCVDLMLIGDYGSRKSEQRDVAAGMASVAQSRQPVAIAGVGDNIYGSGAEGQFSTIVRWWSDIYLKHEALKRPWYIVTGNHDWYTDARVERDFTSHPSNEGGHWRFPGFWYQHSFRSTTSGLVVDTFWIDTQIWKGSSVADRFAGREAKMHQKLWLESALRNSTADWKIVLGHHPVYSRGSHGVTDVLFHELDPMMRRHGVQAIVSGHDHSKHLIQYEGLSYIVNGAGGKRPRSPSNEYPRGSLIKDHQNLGFASLNLCKDRPGQLVFFDDDGRSQSTSQIPAEPPTSYLSGSVRLENGQTLKSLSHSPGIALLKEPSLSEQMCGGRLMRDVDKFCSSKNGSGCRVIADQSTLLTCEHYCREVNGLACKSGWEQDAEDCEPTAELGCHEARASIDAMICECETHQ